MKNIASYQQSINNQRVSKRISSFEAERGASEPVVAGVASDSMLDGAPADGNASETIPSIDPSLRKFVNRSTVADFAKDGGVLVNESHGVHWQPADGEPTNTRNSASSERLTNGRTVQQQSVTRVGTSGTGVATTVASMRASGSRSPMAQPASGIHHQSTAHHTTSAKITSKTAQTTASNKTQVTKATVASRRASATPATGSATANSTSNATAQSEPLLMVGRNTLEGTDSVIGRVMQAILNWYKPIEMSFVCALFVLLILFSYVLHPHSAFISNTIQPAFFSLPTSPISSLEYTILPTIDHSSTSQPIPDIYTPYLPVTYQTYTVEAGQTLSQLAELHGVSMSTLASYNDISNARSLQVGQVYRVPDREGLLIEPSATDTVYAISQRYSVAPEAILDANDLEILELSSSDQLFVPGASLSDFDLRLVIGDLFVFPVRGRLTSGYGYRNDPFTGVRRFHYGLDIASYTGAPIGAAMEGRVSYVGEQRGGYGKYVIVKHPGGFQTLYAHLSTISVNNGQYVSRGQRVGRMGNTGRSTGPHLHFSIIKNGSFVNPALYLY